MVECYLAPRLEEGWTAVAQALLRRARLRDWSGHIRWRELKAQRATAVTKHLRSKVL